MEEDNQISDKSESIDESSPKKRSKPSHDRLSELPDLAIVHILSQLFTEEAARTSVLSKRFNSLWSSVTELNFSDENSGKNGDRFVNFVKSAIEFHHRRKIDKFSVKFCYDAMYRKIVDGWIRFAIQKKVKSLNLNFIQNREVLSDYEHKLPKFLCKYEKLVELVICCCKIRKNVEISWSWLKLLSLQRVKLNEGLISRVLDGCPVLETLELRDWTGFDRLKINSVNLKVLKIIGEQLPKFLIQPYDELPLEISGPSLESLELSGSLYRTRVQLSDVGSLVTAIMDFEIKPQEYGIYAHKCSWFDARNQDIARDVLESLCLVKSLTVGGWFIKVSSLCGIQVLSIYETYNLSSPWSQRESLTLRIPVMKWDHHGVASLLHSSPFTERLVMKFSYCSDMINAWLANSLDYNCPQIIPFKWDLDKCSLQHNHGSHNSDEYYWTSWSTISKCPLAHLKTVKVVDFQASCGVIKPLFRFLQFVLRHSKALEDIVIQTSRYVTREALDEALKLASLPTASPDAVVHFEPPNFWVDPLCVYRQSTPSLSL